MIKEDWGTKIPVFKIDNVRPEAYSVNRILLVVGSDLLPKAQVPTIVYVEDGKFDPKILQNVSADSVKIVMNKGNITDLAMSFLQEDFQSIKNNTGSQWAIFGSDQHLKYKYELLIRDYKFNDFDYGQGIAFSSKLGEKIKFTFDIPGNGKYVIAKRLATEEKQKLTWVVEQKTLNAGKFEYEITNQSSLSVLNTVAIIPEEEFNNSNKLAKSLISTFGIATTADLSSGDWHEAKIKSSDNLKHTYAIDNKDHWLIFTQNYDTNWISTGPNINLPVFSMINGFYIDQNDRVSVEYGGQKYQTIGTQISLGSILVLLVSYLMYEKVFLFCKKLNFFGYS